MSSGGSIVRVSYDGRGFPVAADSDANVALGGKNNEIQMNGDGTYRAIQTRMPGMVGAVSLSIDRNKADLEFLQQRANDPGPEGNGYPFSIELVDGNVYQGRAVITGEVQMSTQNTTAPITFTGSELTLQ